MNTKKFIKETPVNKEELLITIAAIPSVIPNT